MPPNAEIRYCTSQNPGAPQGHPVVVLSDDDAFKYLNLGPDEVAVLVSTSRDVTANMKSKLWGCKYLPIAPQTHPWRTPVSLANKDSKMDRPSSINVDSIYVVPWKELRVLNYANTEVAPSFSAQTLATIEFYVRCPQGDEKKAWRPHDLPCLSVPIVNTTVDNVNASTCTISSPTASTFSDASSVLSVGSTAASSVEESPSPRSTTPESLPAMSYAAAAAVSPRKYVCPGARRGATVLLPKAPMFVPAPKKQVRHEAWTASSWRK
jgi:mRNA-degrading endonuclease toxin of MazEF toxin-antitoxin module